MSATPIDDPWGAPFRALWLTARPAGRRRAADLATGGVRLDAVLGAPVRSPPIPLPDPDRWVATVRDDGTFVPLG